MIARLKNPTAGSDPVLDAKGLNTEGDVEGKLLYPFLSNAEFLAIPESWIRTRDYMVPTTIDKAAGKKYGYFPDYSVWLNGLPLLIVEAKAPDIKVEEGLREARLYATEINKRYAPGVNPIGFILVSNGVHIALTSWDSETDALIVPATDVRPGSAVLSAIEALVGKQALAARERELRPNFERRSFHAASYFIGGPGKLLEQLGFNEFAKTLYPILTKYFGDQSEEATDEIIDRAYVSSEDITNYGSVLDVYLRDRSRKLAGNALEPLIIGKTAAPAISTEISKFSQNPVYFGRVQLIVGSVGAGKSTFIKRYYRRLISSEIKDKTYWSFIDFNVMPPGREGLREWIAQGFISSFSTHNGIDVFDLKHIERIFSFELNKFNKGPNKYLEKIDPITYRNKKVTLLENLMANPVAFAENIARHFEGEKGQGLVIIFDNVDKRDRSDQLAVFEAAQWFKELTKSLVIVPLRDVTFEAYREEPPLDAFINAVNFYIRPPRFSQIIQKRLELVLEKIPSEVSGRQEYHLESGQRITYPVSRLGEFLLSIYLSLFNTRTFQTGAALEALVAKNARRALGMFADIIVSPHVPTSQITGVASGLGRGVIKEHLVLRALMRGRYKLYNERSDYVKNILYVLPTAKRPSNLLMCDLLEFLQRNRKTRIDFQQEGYALVTTIINRMGQLGYNEEDTLGMLQTAVKWGLAEPESLVSDSVDLADAVRLHASGFMHVHILAQRAEYLIGITASMNFSSREVAEQIGSVWANQGSNIDINLTGKKKIMSTLLAYIKEEYRRRCRRHAFYEDNGFGGRILISNIERAYVDLNAIPDRVR